MHNIKEKNTHLISELEILDAQHIRSERKAPTWRGKKTKFSLGLMQIQPVVVPGL